MKSSSRRKGEGVLNEQLRMMQEHFLLQLIRGPWSPVKEIKERLVQLELTALAEERGILRCTAVQLNLPAGSRAWREARIKPLLLAYQKLCRETAYTLKGVYPIPDDINGSMMYFVLLSRGETEEKKRIEQLWEALIRNLAGTLKLEINVGIGGCGRKLKRLKNSYSSALIACTFSHFYRKEEMTEDRMHKLMHSFTTTMERELECCIESPNPSAFSRRLDTLYNPEPEASWFESAFLSLRILLLLSSAAGKYESGGSSLQKYLWNSQSSIVACSSREMFKVQIDGLAQLVMEQVKLVRLSQGRTAAEAIRKYINQYYCSRLTPASLEENYGIAENHLSQWFKEHVGISVNGYITKLRMAQAEQLLKGGGLKITEIARILGYSEPATFISSFKKYSGICPKQFRERQQIKARKI